VYVDSADITGALVVPSKRTPLLDCICPLTFSSLPIHMMLLLKNEYNASEGMPYFAVTVRVTAGLSVVQPVD
jgi:hypothetical protein